MARGVPALELARLSDRVYDSWPEVDLRLRLYHAGMRRTATWDRDDTQGMLVEADDWSAIVFRGTEASDVRVRDLWANLTWPWPVAWAGKGRAHSGYKHALEAVALEALDMARKIAPERPLYITGHSMGGSLATLFASWYAVEKPTWRLAGLVTFGAPKALDREAGAQIGCPIERYVMPGDPAPYWPPVWGLSHPAPENRLKPINSGSDPRSRHDAWGFARSLEKGPAAWWAGH